MSWSGSWPGAIQALSVPCSARRLLQAVVPLACLALGIRPAVARRDLGGRGAGEPVRGGRARGRRLRRRPDRPPPPPSRASPAAHPGTTGAGLAQLAAGLTLLEGGRAADAVGPLAAADVRRTALADYALAGLAGGLTTLGQPQKAADAAAALVLAYPQSPLLCAALLQERRGRGGRRPPDARAASLRAPADVVSRLRGAARCCGSAVLRLAPGRPEDGVRRVGAARPRRCPRRPRRKDARRSLAALGALLPPRGLARTARARRAEGDGARRRGSLPGRGGAAAREPRARAAGARRRAGPGARWAAR